MGYAITLRFEGVTEADYWAVNEVLGIERDGTGDVPAGLRLHTAGPLDGGWMVSEVWDDKATFDAWLGGPLGEAFGTLGIPEPTQVIDTQTVNLVQAPA
jgi:hypothetical protein